MSERLVFTKQRFLQTFALPAGLAVLAACSSSTNDSTTTDPAPDSGIAQDGEDNQAPGTGAPDSDGSAAEDDSASVNTGLDIPQNLVLTALPNPPRTPAPGQSSIPLPAEANTTTIVGYTALRDAIGDIEQESALSDEDFLQGLPPAIISTPEDVDPATNAPPYFVNIDNVEVFAGQELVVVFDPEDDDGGLPGMFPNSGPEGAAFVDNFDGTKSLRWSPLEPDVGIHEFTVTAVDPLVPLYRSTQTIRIKVSLPSDLSTIRNLAPSVNRIRPHTVRVNDPVVAYIKVGDPNGTIPVLEIVNPPAGASIVPHPFEEAVTILHFIPDAPANLALELVAIDSVDPSLTGSQTVSIEILPAEDFQRTGPRLRDLAAQHDLLIGYAALQSYYERLDGAIYTEIAGEEFNIVTTENSLKFDFVNPLPGTFRWAATDNLVQLAKLQDQVVHGHTLVWHRQLPGWVQRSELADRELIMREYIDRVLSRYAADIPIWDVVNESLEEDGTLRNSVWFQAMGASYIDIAFRQARLSAPDAQLIYNDYDVAFAGPKFDGMLNLMQQLRDAGTPLDGVGFQMHLFADFDALDEVRANFQAMANLDLDIYITELDIAMTDGQTLADQAALYEQVLSICLEQPRCKALQTWGYTDMYSWRSQYDPLLLDERYQTKPAYSALQQRLTEN